MTGSFFSIQVDRHRAAHSIHFDLFFTSAVGLLAALYAALLVVPYSRDEPLSANALRAVQMGVRNCHSHCGCACVAWSAGLLARWLRHQNRAGD